VIGTPGGLHLRVHGRVAPAMSTNPSIVSAGDIQATWRMDGFNLFFKNRLKEQIRTNCRAHEGKPEKWRTVKFWLSTMKKIFVI
jgi:hypothetical protein